MSTTSTAPDADRSIDVDSGSSSRLARLLIQPSTATFIILAVIIAVFSVIEPSSFARVDNARAIATDASILLVLAVAVNFPMITAGIDLSTGSVLVFSGVVSVKAMHAMGGDGSAVAVVGGVVAVGSGIAWGALHGVLVAYGRIPAFITTLGTLGAALGLSYIIAGGFDLQDVPTSVTSIGSHRVAGIPALVLVAAVVALVFGLLLHTTRFGRHTYAIGANEEAARRASINVNTHLVKVYVIAGGLTGLAGFLSLGRFATTTLAGHSTDNLQAVTAVVLGGTSLFGGTGAILGTVAGVFIPTVLQNGFVVSGVTPYWQQVAVGIVLIAAVYLDRVRRSRAA
jgi:ribose transport system permease protein